MPQSITIDLGKVYNNISTIYCVPKYKTVATVVNNGSIESYKISTSTDNINFTLINSGIWSGDTKMKIASFIPTSARYIKVEALSAVDGYAAVTEFEIGQETPTGIKNDQGSLSPGIFQLDQNYPNPFNPDTKIGYRLPVDSNITLQFYNILGKKLLEKKLGIMKAGNHDQNINMGDFSSGIYLYRIIALGNNGNKFVSTKKMIVLK